MYCIKRDKCYSIDNTICPFSAYYNQPVPPVAPCSMTNPNIAHGGYYSCQNYSMPINYSGFQMNPMCNPNFYNYNTMGNMGISMIPVPVEEIED